MANKIPHPPRTFFVGNLPQIAGKDTLNKMIQLGYEYGPIFEIAILNEKLLFINNFELSKEILSDEERFPKHINVPTQHLRVIAGDGLFTAWSHEPNWKKAHNILMPGFSQRSMRGYVPVMKKIVDRLLEKWEKIPPTKYFNLSDDMTRYTFDTIGVCGFDYNFDSFKSEKEHDFIPAMLFALDEAVRRARTIPFLMPFRFKRNKAFKKHLTYINNLIDEIIAKRKQNPEAYANKFDFLSLMMNAYDKETGTQLSDENMRYQILTFMIAGHETTSGLLSFAFYNLLTHKEWLDKVYREIDGVLGDDLEQEITHRELAKMKVIRQVLFETLRLYPPVPVMTLAPTQDTTLKNGAYKVPKETSIAVWPYHLHRDKAIWGDDPETFDPNHFLPEKVAKRDKDAFKAFGNGKRACIGSQFALTEATLALAMILQRYKLHLDPNYTFGFNETVTLRPLDLKVRLEPRTKADRYRFIANEAANKVTEVANEEQQHKTPLLILYGSNMGNSEELAHQLAKDGKRHGFKTTIATLDAYKERLPQTGLVQIICSTYNGTPPDNARQFADWLKSATHNLSGLKYAVFGCGNSQWKSYQAFPNWLDKRLSELGAVAFCAKGAADASVDFDADFEKWYANYWANLRKQLKITAKETAVEKTVLKLKKVEKNAVYQCPNFVPKGFDWGTIVQNKELQNTERSQRSTKQIQIALPKGSNYQIGDYLLVQPQNNPKLIERVCHRFKLSATNCYEIDSNDKSGNLPLQQPILLYDLLRHFVELQSLATRRQLKLLINWTSCPPEKMRLQLYEQNFNAEIVAKKRSLLSLLEEFEACELSFELFLEQLPHLQARYYSIASSPLVEGNTCSLTVGVLDEGNYQGICSNYLGRAKHGQKILVAVRRPNLDFTLPQKNERPIIMIGAGTGIAPFRGFIQERLWRQKEGQELGNALLFFGCRASTQDFLYREELESAVEKGVLELYTAFSREKPQHKVYVQDQLLMQQDLIWDCLERDAIVYICGDAAGMAKGVELAFEQIYNQNNSDNEATTWLENMKRNGRYKTEIWT
ncbi:bifunctional cytochrome P450/NADPH--P450 reductase [Aureispira anguillae]|uniref:Bifunctional cytochrome P450/NADPH--P450 reductase n=1 Tax=Aureispira anguillae TaxID=2864201 RepID=A0A915YE03_9BACT|nr:bifunctional cytochrome P450/NADPH--P450 reductase [Aureispira anguillae]BDS11317.1 bifunctional cytochrome P450/NADPH--P450 reductase [Aureispira anguillae]